MSPGHQIPMLDIAKHLASRNIKTTILTSPLNLSRFQSSPLPSTITLLPLHFPSAANGGSLPPNCENLDSLPSRLLTNTFTHALTTLQSQADDLVRQYHPDAIISDLNLPWTAQIASKYSIPRIVFHGTNCFSLSITHSLHKYKPYETVTSDFEPFLVPGLPNPVHVSKSQMPSRFFRNIGLHEFLPQFAEAERKTYGVIVNSFSEIEPEFIEHYRKICGKKVWPVGPVSLFNEPGLNISERGNKVSIDKDFLLTWLDSKVPNSVIYVCFGGLCVFAESQLVEIGLGLEASNCCFIWVIREGCGDGIAVRDLEERVKGRGIIIRGWAPQVMILSHSAVGGFLTHCGWNSVLESVSYGVPIIAWPLFAEQFYNARLAMARLRIGFEVCGDTGLKWGEEEEAGALVKRGRVKAAVTRLMGGGESVKKMRERVGRLSELARLAVSEGGSSDVNLDLLIEDLLSQRKERLAKGEDKADQF